MIRVLQRLDEQFDRRVVHLVLGLSRELRKAKRSRSGDRTNESGNDVSDVHGVSLGDKYVYVICLGESLCWKEGAFAAEAQAKKRAEELQEEANDLWRLGRPSASEVFYDPVPQYYPVQLSLTQPWGQFVPRWPVCEGPSVHPPPDGTD